MITDIPNPDIAISMGCNGGCPFIGKAFDDNWERLDPTLTFGTATQILSNEKYAGTYVYNMQERSVLNSGSIRNIPKEKWGRVENHHEAIISKEDFDKVQQIKEKNKFLKGKNTNYPWRNKSPLQGFVRCPTCNHILTLTQSNM